MKLRWFQFHLSTAVLLMFAAGGLIGLNVRERLENVEWAGGSGDYRGNSCFGFPVDAWVEDGNLFANGKPGEVAPFPMTEIEFRELKAKARLESKNDPEDFRLIPGKGIYSRREPGKYSPPGIAVNTLFAVVILVFVAFMWEYFSYRRTSQ